MHASVVAGLVQLGVPAQGQQGSRLQLSACWTAWAADRPAPRAAVAAIAATKHPSAAGMRMSRPQAIRTVRCSLVQHTCHAAQVQAGVLGAGAQLRAQQVLQAAPGRSGGGLFVGSALHLLGLGTQLRLQQQAVQAIAGSRRRHPLLNGTSQMHHCRPHHLSTLLPATQPVNAPAKHHHLAEQQRLRQLISQARHRHAARGSAEGGGGAAGGAARSSDGSTLLWGAHCSNECAVGNGHASQRGWAGDS